MCVDSVLKRTDINNDPRGANDIAHLFGKGCEAISKQYGPSLSLLTIIIYTWKTFHTISGLPKSGFPTKVVPRSDCPMLREILPKAASHVLTTSLSIFKGKCL